MAVTPGSLEEMLKDRWVLCLCVAHLIFLPPPTGNSKGFK